MKVVLITLKYEAEYDPKIKIEEVELDWSLKGIVQIFGITDCIPSEYFEDGSGGGCAETEIKVYKNHITHDSCQDYIYPYAFEVDGEYFSGNRKILFIGIENILKQTAPSKLSEICQKIKLPIYTKVIS